jgi:trehalose-phosphatase
MSTDVPIEDRLSWMDSFFAQLARATHRTLLLDYDGTLAPFRLERSEAAPYPGVRERLQRIVDGGHTRLVFISGRRVKSLVPLLELNPVPEIWGAHGWERRYPDGRIETQPMDPPDASAIGLLLERFDARGLASRCELKPGSLTLHLRGLSIDEAEKVRDETLEEAPGLIAGSTLQVRDFQGGVEFYLDHTHKGVAVETVLNECDETCLSAFLGDDVTDEDAFRVMKRLAGRGLGIRVAPDQRPSAARHWLRPPDELLDFLERWANLEGAG